jgi:DNA-binding transcriptional LysR family regulator
MLNLNDFVLFVQVVERKGLMAAGRTLGIPKSTLNYRIQQLESQLGVRLINRTSRQFGPTQAGKEFYMHALSIVNAAEEAKAFVRQRVKVPSGVVRFAAASGHAQYALREILTSFMQDFPTIHLVEHVTSREVDLLTENIDVAIRAHSGARPDSILVCRTLATARWILVAGGGDLKKKSLPRVPQDLAQFPCLAVWRTNTAPVWRLRAQSSAQRNRTEVTLPLSPRLVSDDMSTLKRAATAGLGIVALPAYTCKRELQSGELIRVLPGWITDESTYTAVLPHRPGLRPAIRIFVEYLTTHLPKYVTP